MTVEFKKVVWDDAFSDDGSLERTTKVALDTLGQITLYATAHQAAQFRTHVFLVLVFPSYARFMRWDRSGAIVTEKFFWRFNHASPAARGVDTTAREFLYNHPAAAKAKRIPPRPLDLCLQCLLYRNWELVLLKDTWRIVSATQSPEHMIYERLKKHGVRNICTCKEGCDVLQHCTKTQDSSMVKRPSPFRRLQHYRLVLNEIGRSLSDFRDTKEMVTAVRDAIVAHGDAYDKAEILHRDISSGNILITATGGGLLIDWDLCKMLKHIHQGEAHTERTVITSPTIRTLLGTWQFMAARLLVVPTPGQPPAIPDRADDLESFFYVLVWIALRYTKHGFFKNALTDMLHAAFDHHYLDPDGAAKGGDRKKVEVCFSDPFQVSRLFNVPLKEMIETLAITFAVRYEKAPKARDIVQYRQLFEREGSSDVKPVALGKPADDDAIFSALLAGKYLKRLATLKRSDWMESELTTALQNSGWTYVPKTEGGADPISDDPFR
ncbi:hypothetical protein BU17DRAFT_70468 [Hysterangium stoloniferum]|nr:hypothetical protein BU17DRAFT_70468 [Hysterangium stoloniferum]